MSESGNTKPRNDDVIKATSDENRQAAIPTLSGTNGKESFLGTFAAAVATGRRALKPSKRCQMSQFLGYQPIMRRV